MEGFKEAKKLDELKDFVQQNELAFVYIYRTNCSVCHAVMPQITPILAEYPQIKTLQVSADRLPEISSEYTIFTVPVLLLFADSREVMRFARFVEMGELKHQLKKITDAYQA